MTVAPPELDQATLDDLESALEPAPATPKRSRLPEITVATLIALGGYIWAAWWLKYTYHYAIGDALARSADAKFMIFSRDAHAAAIGVYWMPLPTVSEIPAMLLMGPFHHYEFAGPLTSAMWAAGTVFILGRIARDLGCGRLTGLLVCVGYGANPVIVFYAANGMAEACEFFWVAFTLWGLLRLIRRPATQAPGAVGPAVLAGIGLAGLCLAKYEAVPAIGAVTVVVVLLNLKTLRARRLEPVATELCLVVLPALFVCLLWLGYMRVITGSFTTFLEVGKVTQGTGATSPVVLAAQGSASRSGHYVLHYLAGFGPGVVILALLLLKPTWRNLLQGLALLGVLAAIVGLSAKNIYTGGSLGNPRYFVPIAIIAAVASLVVASALRSRVTRLALDLLVVALLVAGSVGAVRVELGKTDSVENENRVFGALDGRYNSTPTEGDQALDDKTAAAEMDSLLRPGERVLLDTRFESGVALYTHHLNQFVITADRDYEQIVAPDGAQVRLDFAVTAPAGSYEGAAEANDDAGNVVRREPGWTVVWQNSAAEIWHRDPVYNRGLPNPVDG